MSIACVFCSGNENDTIIYKDEKCYATISLNPINKYHVLIIPYRHYESFIDLPDELASHLFIITKKLSKAVRLTCSPDVITHLSDDDITNSGHNLVSHYKIHIIPRFQNDKVKIDWGRDNEDKGIDYRIEIANEIKHFLR